MDQLIFDFNINKNNIDDGLVICQSNLKIFQFLHQYHKISNNLPNLLSIIGKKNSGKTSFIEFWQSEFQATPLNEKDFDISDLNDIIKHNKFYCLDNICQILNQEFLFHLINIIKEKSSFLLLTSSKKLINLEWKFNDLSSRIKNIHQLEIPNPDDDLVKILLTKYFSTKQLKVDQKILDYLLNILDRDFEKIFLSLQKIEARCFEENKKITIPFVKKILINTVNK